MYKYFPAASITLLIYLVNASPYEHGLHNILSTYDHQLRLGNYAQNHESIHKAQQSYTPQVGSETHVAVSSADSKDFHAITTQEICNNIPISIEKKCSVNVPASEAFNCSQLASREICELKNREIPSKCYKIVNEEVQYKCPQQNEEQICYGVPYTVSKMCKKQVIKKVQEECMKSVVENVCKVEKVEVESKCFRTKKVDVSYQCKHVEMKNLCKSEYRNVPYLCKKEVVTQNPYVHKGVSYENVCENVLKVKQGSCEKTVYEDEEYPCTEIVKEKECKDIIRVTAKECTSSTVQTRMVDCSVQEQRFITKQCLRTKKEIVKKTECNHNKVNELVETHARLYPYELIDESSHSKRGGSDIIIPRRLMPMNKKGCYEVPVEVDKMYMEECEEAVMVIVPKICPKTETIPVKSVCPSSDTENVCIEVPKTVNKTCKRKVARLETYPCNDTVQEHECKTVKIPTKNIAYKPNISSETYSCNAKELVETCIAVPNVVESICLTSVMQAEEYSCPTTVMQQKCENINSDVPSVCLVDQIMEEEYPCYSQSIETVCETFPVYKNTGVCTAVIQKVDEFDCMKTDLQQICHDEDQTIAQTCYRSTTKQKEYTCFENSIKPLCETFSIHALPNVNTPRKNHDKGKFKSSASNVHTFNHN